MSHTQGPWKDDEGIIRAEHGPIIARVYDEFLFATREANARLIAAAPDMLEALKNLENDSNLIPDHAWKLVQDAIKKAEGQ